MRDLMGLIESCNLRRLSLFSSINNTVINYQLMNEAEYLMKNYRDWGGCYADNTLRLYMIRKPNSKIVLLFIQINSLFKT